MSKRSWARLPKECIIPSCDNKPAAKGMCSTHYCRQRDGIDMDAPIVKRTQNVGESYTGSQIALYAVLLYVATLFVFFLGATFAKERR